MRLYNCQNCSNNVHFENTACLSCGFDLGYAAIADEMLSKPFGDDVWQTNTGIYRRCANRATIACNWVSTDDGDPLCISCRHSRVIPDLNILENRQRWELLEHAKRMLFYALQKFGLLQKADNISVNALIFEFMADRLPMGEADGKVLTGHHNGLITINIAEADDDVREARRKAMNEPYRTLIGHFRHEVGHYYWDLLLADETRRADFRTLFGDERADYTAALEAHYAHGAQAFWEQNYVSAYATSHPWEDFAETWAHYFHMVDGLETAQEYGVLGHSGAFVAINPYLEQDFRQLHDEWIPLTVALNAVNRSIGNRDFYPFVLSQTIFDKLNFVHQLIHSSRN